ncbi:MAG: type II secretion system protein [Gammaproteobacteria bacterium]|nr:type II secretion system protein [Gammaproteobacteria bacterium]
MSPVTWILIAEAGMLLGLAAILMRGGRDAGLEKRISERFAVLYTRPRPSQNRTGWWGRLCRRYETVLTRAGLAPDQRRLRTGVSVAGVLVLYVALRHGPAAAVMALMVGLIAVYALLQYRYRKRAELLLAQLPRFVDNLDRSLAAGHSLQNALGQAAALAREPLQGILLRVKSNVDLGGELGEQLQLAANAMAVKEFQLLALAMDVHQRYGGSIKALLHSVSGMVKQQEQARREFAALTGETRFSAWVLGLLPLLIAGYMLAMNPGYLDSMWNTEAGRSVLYLAVGLQATGGLILWRMIKSI